MRVCFHFFRVIRICVSRNSKCSIGLRVVADWFPLRPCAASQDGSIARHLQFVSHNVRTKLDEVKRREVERLRELAIAEARIQLKRDGQYCLSAHYQTANLNWLPSLCNMCWLTLGVTS